MRKTDKELKQEMGWIEGDHHGNLQRGFAHLRMLMDMKRRGLLD